MPSCLGFGSTRGMALASRVMSVRAWANPIKEGLRTRSWALQPTTRLPGVFGRRGHPTLAATRSTGGLGGAKSLICAPVVCCGTDQKHVDV
jgi:hypothetical protein